MLVRGFCTTFLSCVSWYTSQSGQVRRTCSPDGGVDKRRFAPLGPSDLVCHELGWGQLHHVVESVD